MIITEILRDSGRCHWNLLPIKNVILILIVNYMLEFSSGETLKTKSGFLV